MISPRFLMLWGFVLIILQLAVVTHAFVPQSDKATWKKSSPALSSLVTKPTFTVSSSTTSLHLFDFFRRNTDDEEKGDNKKKVEESTGNDDEPVQEKVENIAVESTSASEGNDAETKGRVPFFANIFSGKNEEEKAAEEVAATNTAAVVVEAEAPKEEAQKEPIVPPKPAPKPQLSPLEQAQAMKAQAERMRLEAEKMDARLTLEKIEKLEKELVVAKAKGETTEELQKEMDALQAKIRGETPKPKVITSVAATTTTSDSGTTTSDDDFASRNTDKWGNYVGSGATRKISDEMNSEASKESSDFVGILSEMQGGIGPFNQEEFDGRVKAFNDAPGFMKRTMANMVALDFDTTEDINGTEVAVRFEKMDRKDYSFLNVPKPKFSTKMIQEMEQEIESKPAVMFQEILRTKADGNNTALAVMLLEDFYYEEMLGNQFTEKNFGVKVEVEDRWKNIFEGGDDYTEGQRTAEALFPKCMRKEDQEGPTEAQVKMLATDVLPKASFNPSGKPEAVIGGWVIRGTNKEKNGDDLMEKIEAVLAKNRAIGDKLSVFYVKDFTIYGDESADIIETPPILYVTGADITPTRRRGAYTLISALGLGTAWYESIYPCLMNPDVMKRTEEQMSLADANMAYDLSWLTELAAPIFLSFLGIQIAHEAGHRVAAAVYGTNITLPTFVPSLVTGITSSITTFKSPPKNNEAMFDFAIAGPLCGIIASLSALYFGLEMTVFTDAQSYAKFPALPLEILRQSSLGGGIVEAVLGQGALSVPDAAMGSQMVSNINIPLHPLAVAGYIGLIINALSLLPIGTTDGGRIALTLFGRGLKLVIGQVFLILMFILGLSGSDLFLFYFSFIVFFQNGNEIPAKNEFDEISFSRVLLATGMGVVTLLSLIPMS